VVAGGADVGADEAGEVGGGVGEGAGASEPQADAASANTVKARKALFMAVLRIGS